MIKLFCLLEFKFTQHALSLRSLYRSQRPSVTNPTRPAWNPVESPSLPLDSILVLPPEIGLEDPYEPGIISKFRWREEPQCCTLTHSLTHSSITLETHHYYHLAEMNHNTGQYCLLKTSSSVSCIRMTGTLFLIKISPFHLALYHFIGSYSRIQGKHSLTQKISLDRKPQGERHTMEIVLIRTTY